ncbi:hypothetical protein JCM10908_004263 [Rhodotorula pacifica]|uniref:uncharacterized protein n=1 Tax=Rhodotorula pacifica TaxID=1495444 RepID=UPI003172517F
MQSAPTGVVVEQPAYPLASTSSAGFAALSGGVAAAGPVRVSPSLSSMALPAGDAAAIGSSTSSSSSSTSSSVKGKSIAAIDTASIHRLKRPATKVFRCTGYGDCSMTFSRSEHLARHVRKHTGERPFKCHCGREFSRLDNVRQHAMTVHGNMLERNQDTLNALANLHNELSVATVQHQREAGMIVQDPTAKSRRKSSTTTNTTAADVKAKPKKDRVVPRKKPKVLGGGKPVAGASSTSDATPSTSLATQAKSSPYAPHAKESSIYAFAPTGEVAAQPYEPLMEAYDAAAPDPHYPPAPLHHQQIYGAMAPASGSSIYPGMEFYSPNSPPSVYPTPPSQHLPMTASPHQPLARDPVAPTHDPVTASYAPVEAYEAAYVEAAPVTMFAAPPPPPAVLQQPEQQPAAEMDPLASVKVSLPSISALLPAFSEEDQHRLQQDPGSSHLHGLARAPYHEQRTLQHQAPSQPQYHSAALAYSTTAGSSLPSRPPSQLDMPTPLHHVAPSAYSEYPFVAQQAAPPPAAHTGATQMNMQYPEPLQAHQTQVNHAQPQSVAAPAWYGPAASASHEPFARAAPGIERGGPPSLGHDSPNNAATPSGFATNSPHSMHAPGSLDSHYNHPYPPSSSLHQQQAHPSYPYPSPASMGERPAYEVQDPRVVAAPPLDYGVQRDYSAHYASAPPSTISQPPYHASPQQQQQQQQQQQHLSFFPPNSSYPHSESYPPYGHGKYGMQPSQAYSMAPPYPPVAQRSGLTPPFSHSLGGGTQGAQRPNGWAAPPSHPR